MAKITIKVDPNMCIGAAACVTVAPESFALNTENKAWVLDHGKNPDGDKYERTVEVTDEERDNLILAAESCPVLAVTILDETGAQLFPRK